MKLPLSKAECEAVMDYIYQHARSSPNGRAFKVWQKMFEFVNDDQQELNFSVKNNCESEEINRSK